MSRPAPFAIATLALGVLLAACGSSDDGSAAESTADAGAGGGFDLVTEGSLTLCTNPPYEPFEYEEGGEIVGFDIALVAEIAADLDLELAIINTGFDGIQSGAALNAGQCDIVASAITITEARAGNMDFTLAYFDADQAVLVPTGSAVTSEADLADLTVGVQQATTGAEWVAEQGITGVEFEDLGLQVQALRNGQIDAAVNDVAVLASYADEELEVALTIPTGEEYGFAVRQGDTALLEAVNTSLERVFTDGTYEEIWAEFIGGEPVSRS